MFCRNRHVDGEATQPHLREHFLKKTKESGTKHILVVRYIIFSTAKPLKRTLMQVYPKQEIAVYCRLHRLKSARSSRRRSGIATLLLPILAADDGGVRPFYSSSLERHYLGPKSSGRA